MAEEKRNFLILKYIGMDDDSCPTYQEQYKHLWKDLNQGFYKKLDLYSVTNDELDGEPLSPILSEYTFDPQPFQRSRDEYSYMMLARLQHDCEFYIRYGCQSVLVLYTHDPKEQIEYMKKIWQSLPADGKPEWLTWEQILEYEKVMAN